MKTTLQVKLLPSADQHTALLTTMHAFNAACTWIATHAYAQRCASKFQLQKQLYQEVRQRFGLSAQLAIRAIAKTVEAYKRDKTVQVAFRPDGAVVYDERIMAFRGVDAVSLMVLHGREIIPMQMGEYQRVQFARAKGQADLVLKDGTFYLLVTIETPEAPPMIPERFMGIDLGIVNVAADSTGNLYSGTDVERVRQRCQCHRASFQRTGHEICQTATQETGGQRIPLSAVGQPPDSEHTCCPGARHEGRACPGRFDGHPRTDNGSQARAQQA